MIFRKHTDPAADVEAVEAPETAGAELDRLRNERIELILLCLYARDRLPSGAAATRIDEGLQRLGIAPVTPEGERFDPTTHEAAATVPTDDPALHDTVAETELPGYRDHGRVVREPVVTVYRVDEDGDR